MPVNEMSPILRGGEAAAGSTPTPTRAPVIAQWIRNPRGRAAGGMVLAAAGLGLGWEWLAAVGALPALLSLLPCAAMCAVGLCMGKGRESCSRKPSANPISETDIDRAAQPPELRR